VCAFALVAHRFGPRLFSSELPRGEARQGVLWAKMNEARVVNGVPLVCFALLRE